MVVDWSERIGFGFGMVVGVGGCGFDPVRYLPFRI
jgi:hypothetical protein